MWEPHIGMEVVKFTVEFPKGFPIIKVFNIEDSGNKLAPSPHMDGAKHKKRTNHDVQIYW